MKLRYYLRGLGIGILVTAFLMGAVQGDGKAALSDEEIKARAAGLGMVESVVLSDLDDEDSAQKASEGSNPEVADAGSREPSGSSELPVASEPSVSKYPSEMPESSVSKDPSEAPGLSESSESPETPKTSGSKAPVDPLEPSENTAGSVTITIKRGDSSVAVSKALEAAGLVADAKAYDRYLCAGGYDKTLSVGSYEIPVGADNEEIARIITGKK